MPNAWEMVICRVRNIPVDSEKCKSIYERSHSCKERRYDNNNECIRV